MSFATAISSYASSPSSPDFAPHRPNHLARAESSATSATRRSKRDSTASITRQREQAADRYPSPPPGGMSSSQSTGGIYSSADVGGGSRIGASASRAQSIEASLHIPPYNPGRRTQVPVFDRAPSTRASDRDRSPVEVDQLSSLPVPSRSGSVSRPSSAMVTPIYASSSAASSSAPYPTASASRSRQSVSVLPSTQHQQQQQQTMSLSSAGPYPTLYQPHPMPRQKVYFGPYILLQTLGEGEFGKVKLGIHSERWGEEVAIKLIKRGNVDTAQRGEKVRREIEVLKAVRHPNIVRLYDVIETEKYIGIVLEYASGGELFDHILAHRYLKERDAARLFAQLISGVSYLHSKKVVHRDLKLENLLLDRNRNVIITDFGFANRFMDSADDLMSTSCGSPCYAAPELVVQEGKYVGTAVDVWSCGVILYAMLAGYLPYDDDPANPEGDNINLLYKYIINTPLTFPDWISGEPRDLLLRMLVPDPRLRCTIDQVTSHSWLRKYATMFLKSPDELEMIAQEAELTKRQMLEAQRQFLIQQQHAIALAASSKSSQAQSMIRSQSSTGAGEAGGAGAGMGPNTRHRSAMIIPSSAPHHPQPEMIPIPTPRRAASPVVEEVSSSHNAISNNSNVLLPIPPYQPRSTTSSISSSQRQRRSIQIQTAPVSPTIQSHLVTVDATSFSFVGRPSTPPTVPDDVAELPTSVPMLPSISAPPNPPTVVADDVMMVDAMPLAPIENESRSRRVSARLSAAAPGITTSTSSDLTSATIMIMDEEQKRKRANRATVQVEYDGGSADRIRRELLAASRSVRVESVDEDSVMDSPVLPSTMDISTEESAMKIDGQDDVDIVNSDIDADRSSPIVIDSSTVKSPIDISLSSRLSSPTVLAATAAPSEIPTTDAHALPLVIAPTLDVAPTPAVAPPMSPTSPTTRQRKGMSTDRFSFRSLLGGSSSPEKVVAAAAAAAATAEARELADEAVLAKRRSTRRQKAMSLQPFSKGSSSTFTTPSTSTTSSSSSAKTSLARVPVPESTDARSRSSTVNPLSAAASQGQGSMPPPATRVISARPTRMMSPRSPTTDSISTIDAAWIASKSNSTSAAATMGTGTSKAKSVMDWFRRKSIRGMDSVAASSPMTTDFDRRRFSALSSVAGPTLAAAAPKVTKIEPAPRSNPSVIVTAVADDATVRQTRAATLEQRRISITNPSPPPQSSPTSSTTSIALPTAPKRSAIAAAPEVRLRVHQGALDRNAVTSKSPALIMEDIRKVLWNMGIQLAVEGDFKLKCVRSSRKKVLAATIDSRPPSPSAPGSTYNVRSSVVDRRPSLLPSSPSLISNLGSSSPANTFRSFFARKSVLISPAHSPASPSSSVFPSAPSPSTTAGGSMDRHSHLQENDLLASPMSPSTPQFTSSSSPTSVSLQPFPVYGDASSTDTGDEIRFYVEMTQVKNLAGLYYVDIKRMKGGVFSFKYVYDRILGEVDLGVWLAS